MLVIQSTLIAFDDPATEYSPVPSPTPIANPPLTGSTAMRMPNPFAMPSLPSDAYPYDVCDFDDSYEDAPDPLTDYLEAPASRRRRMEAASGSDCNCPYCAHHRAVMGFGYCGGEE